MEQNQNTPKTIQELKEWAQYHNLPLEDMRVFIGEDYREAKAYGIYEDYPGHFVVYKNKSTGERAVRYEGDDEAYAVNELYLKMKERVADQKAFLKSPESKSIKDKIYSVVEAIILVIVLWVVASNLISVISNTMDSLFFKSRGYYSYNNTYYYRLESIWYYFDDFYDTWYYATDVDDELNDNYKQYYEGKTMDDQAGYTDFKDTSYYEDWDGSDSDSFWDSDDSWDSGLDDWDSDW